MQQDRGTGPSSDSIAQLLRMLASGMQSHAIPTSVSKSNQRAAGERRADSGLKADAHQASTSANGTMQRQDHPASQLPTASAMHDSPAIAPDGFDPFSQLREDGELQNGEHEIQVRCNLSVVSIVRHIDVRKREGE